MSIVNDYTGTDITRCQLQKLTVAIQNKVIIITIYLLYGNYSVH